MITHYQEKLKDTSHDVELVGLLAGAHVENEQIDAYHRGLELAPANTELRLKLIALLRNVERFEEAAMVYEVLREQ